MAARFPGESPEYREARDRLLESEAELRSAIERVAQERRELPAGGVVPQDYAFQDVNGGEVRFSELFAAGKETLVTYNFMFPRSPDDDSPGPASGPTAELPIEERPCGSCTSILDSLDGATPHLLQRVNLAVIAKSAPDRIRTFAEERGWRHLPLYSSAENDFNRDYLGETEAGEQMPIPNVFRRDGTAGEIRHFWGTELLFASWDPDLEPRHVDFIWPIWNVLDATPDGRGAARDFPRLGYDD